jgi:hypothetical protein
MIDLIAGMLPVIGQPFDDVLGLVGIDLVDVVDPRLRFAAVTWNDARRPVEIEACGPALFHPTAGHRQAVRDEQRQSGMPRRLLDALVFINPARGRQRDDPAVLGALRLSLLVEHRNARQSCDHA